MIQLGSLSLYDEATTIDDVQVWSKVSQPPDTISELSQKYKRIPDLIDFRIIPIYLIASKPLICCSSAENTSEYFRHNLIRYALSNEAYNGILFQQDENQDKYLLFFHIDSAIQMVVLDLSHVAKIVEAVSQTKETGVNIFITSETPMKEEISNTSVFDRVLSNKKKPVKVDQINTKQSTLSNADQINQTINRIILSGLRIRGLSLNLNHSVNEKLTIKEIYQMTLKSTLFAIRKYNYTFNGANGANANVSSTNAQGNALTVTVIQEIVEKLLQVYIDVDEYIYS